MYSEGSLVPDLKKITIILLISMLFFALSFTIFAQNSKIYLEKNPIDFIASGDDITYEHWVKEYIKRREAAGIEIHFDRIRKIRNQEDIPFSSEFHR